MTATKTAAPTQWFRRQSTAGLVRTIVACLLIIAPRSALAYPMYLGASVLLLDLRHSPRGALPRLVFIYLVAVTSILGAAFFGSISLTAAALELVLLFPFLAFLSGIRVVATRSDCLKAFRLINFILFATGFLSLIRQGFPFRLPYVNFAPDFFYGTYGTGGARLVTIFGFFGIVTELVAAKEGRMSRLGLAIAFVNFLLPSYIIGICCGVAALGFNFARRPSRLILILILSLPALNYAVGRLSTSNNVVQRQTGHQPKILAYIKVKELYGHSPLLSASGSGPGEFTSIPQTWASEAIRRISVQAVPPVPGLFSSSYYVEHIAPLSDITFESTYAISSSLNKPYSGISTLLAEWGLLGTAVLGYLFYKRARHLLVNSRDALAVICFFIVLNLVDLWTDSLWFGFCMLLFTGVVEFGPTLVAQKTASVSSAGDGESPRGQARRGVVSRPS